MIQTSGAFWFLVPWFMANCGNLNFQDKLGSCSSYRTQKDLLEDAPRTENMTAHVNKG